MCVPVAWFRVVGLNLLPGLLEFVGFFVGGTSDDGIENMWLICLSRDDVVHGGLEGW